MAKLTKNSEETPADVPDPKSDGDPALADAPAKRRSALIGEFDFSDAVSKSFRAKPKPRTSKWATALTKLYDATAQNLVPRDEDGALQFVRVGNYLSRNGAQQQAKVLKEQVGATYEFKVVGAQDGTAGLYARVKEIPAAD